MVRPDYNYTMDSFDEECLKCHGKEIICILITGQTGNIYAK